MKKLESKDINIGDILLYNKKKVVVVAKGVGENIVVQFVNDSTATRCYMYPADNLLPLLVPVLKENFTITVYNANNQLLGTYERMAYPSKLEVGEILAVYPIGTTLSVSKISRLEMEAPNA